MVWVWLFAPTPPQCPLLSILFAVWVLMFFPLICLQHVCRTWNVCVRFCTVTSRQVFSMKVCMHCRAELCHFFSQVCLSLSSSLKIWRWKWFENYLKWLPKGSKMEPSAPLGRFREGLGEAIWPEGRFWHGFGLHLGRHLGPSGGSGALLKAFWGVLSASGGLLGRYFWPQKRFLMLKRSFFFWNL